MKLKTLINTLIITCTLAVLSSHAASTIQGKFIITNKTNNPIIVSGHSTVGNGDLVIGGTSNPNYLLGGVLLKYDSLSAIVKNGSGSFKGVLSIRTLDQAPKKNQKTAATSKCEYTYSTNAESSEYNNEMISLTKASADTNNFICKITKKLAGESTFYITVTGATQNENNQ